MLYIHLSTCLAADVELTPSTGLLIGLGGATKGVHGLAALEKMGVVGRQ